MLAPVPPQGAAEEQNPLLARLDELERGLRVEAQKREALEQRLARLEAGDDGALARAGGALRGRGHPLGDRGVRKTRPLISPLHGALAGVAI